MKRFYSQATAEPAETGWRVALDGRPIRTAGGAAQIVPTQVLAEALAREWAGQGEEIDTAAFVLRDMVDLAIDIVAADPAGATENRPAYARADTLCYRGERAEPLYARQRDVWEPLLARIEQRQGLRFERVSGIVHRPQPPETLARLRALLEGQDAFTLAALQTLASLTASLAVALAALEEGADAEALWAAANAEEDWQAEQWGWDSVAAERRAARLAAFARAMEFARLARQGRD